MLLICKIKFADEENKSRVCYGSLPLGITVQSQSKNIQEFAEKLGLEYLFKCSSTTPLLLVIGSKGQLGFCLHIAKH